MSELLHHRFAADLEVRSGDDGRTVMGICCPFDEPTPINEWGVNYTEQFARGAFANTIATRADRVKFLAMHDRGSFPLGRAQVLREDASGLYGEFRVSKTERGDEALELIRDGALDAFSIGFTPIRSTPMQPRNGDSVTRHEARLAEVSAVSFPAYAGAVISGLRGEQSEQAITDAITAMEKLRWQNPEGLDLSKVDTYLGWMTLARAGKALSSATMTELQSVLDLVAAADRAVDDAQPRLAALMGVPNPDEPEGADDADAAGDDAGRAMTPDQARIAIGVPATTSTTTSGNTSVTFLVSEPVTEPVAGLAYDRAVQIARRHRVAL